MELVKLGQRFTVCKVTSLEHIDLTREFVFLAKTDDEISLVCETDLVPDNTTDREDGWRAFKISGILDFGMIGVLADISRVLAANKVSIFVVSTYNTDYLLVKERDAERTRELLTAEGYQMRAQ